MDGEWHTVPSHKHMPSTARGSNSASRGGRGGRGGHIGRASGSSPLEQQNQTTTPRNQQNRRQPQRSFQSKTASQTASQTAPRPLTNPTRPVVAPLGISSSAQPHNEKREDDAENSDDDDESVSEDESGTDNNPLPPYHISIIVLCPFSDCSRIEPFTDSTSVVAHLKSQHHIIFKNIHHMYFGLDKYLEFWAKNTQKDGVEKYGLKEIKDGEEIYIIDPENCEKDKEIRNEFQREKLNEILKIQDKERHDDSQKPRKCLFCKNVLENRAALFRHMFGEHNFNIGLPDNLVNVNEFLDILENKLNNLQCLYCEKIFTTPAVLRKHMRKKKHFKIAPRNRIYDCFYVINYLEPGKNWENFENDRYDDEEDDRRDEAWDDWDEDEPEPTMCLFDEEVLESPEACCTHMVEEHGFDLEKIKADLGLDFYKTITLINYIRHQTSLKTCFSCGEAFEEMDKLTAHMQKEGCIAKIPALEDELWKDPRYLFPTYENDPLLTVFDDDDDDEDEMARREEFQKARAAAALVENENSELVKELRRASLEDEEVQANRGIRGMGTLGD